MSAEGADVGPGPAHAAAGGSDGGAGVPVGPGAGPDLVRAALARAKADAAERASAGEKERRQDTSRGAAATRAAARRAAGRPLREGADEPVALGAAVSALLSERRWQGDLAVASVSARWPELVGPQLAGRCRPQSLQSGELTLVAESTAWATQVRLLGPQLLRRLAAELGDGVVTGLRVHGPTAPSWGHGPWRAGGGRGPRDTYG